MKVPIQRQFVSELTMELLSTNETSDFDACEEGHRNELALKDLFWCSTNIVLKNYCGKASVWLGQVQGRAADDELEGFATRNSLTPGTPLSRWNFFVIHQRLGFPEEGLIDGKFLCSLHYESKLASSAVGNSVSRKPFLVIGFVVSGFFAVCLVVVYIKRFHGNLCQRTTSGNSGQHTELWTVLPPLYEDVVKESWTASKAGRRLRGMFGLETPHDESAAPHVKSAVPRQPDGAPEAKCSLEQSCYGAWNAFPIGIHVFLGRQASEEVPDAIAVCCIAQRRGRN
ncbi:hypothetical protein HPB47_004452 [Ixodes persulcatus]|uniref:Uncharacterized protein n=1 Tax=Ixodes persulcatus TaxID=34615 RepID=A0AC60PH73_IXOPE|nr:hypothetical protein HPB47_004452 [Ixodes persulcatus]